MAICWYGILFKKRDRVMNFPGGAEYAFSNWAWARK
jgi:hypothetical protein